MSHFHTQQQQQQQQQQEFYPCSIFLFKTIK